MIGIGSDCPTTKLEIKGYSKFDNFLIRIIHWYFEKRKISVTFFHKTDDRSPSEKLYITSNGNIGTGV